MVFDEGEWKRTVVPVDNIDLFSRLRFDSSPCVLPMTLPHVEGFDSQHVTSRGGRMMLGSILKYWTVLEERSALQAIRNPFVGFF
jgi:hypothetical protein